MPALVVYSYYCNRPNVKNCSSNLTPSAALIHPYSHVTVPRCWYLELCSHTRLLPATIKSYIRHKFAHINLVRKLQCTLTNTCSQST